ncbi:hypothetical protein J6590_007066 [Homalodisca vitripennis]|nr:hypothetical protein J6590_007066 [Homalodisca vitripennis]
MSRMPPTDHGPVGVTEVKRLAKPSTGNSCFSAYLVTVKHTIFMTFPKTNAHSLALTNARSAPHPHDVVVGVGKLMLSN